MDLTTPAVSPRTLELAQTLVRINTVSANSNLPLIHFVRDELARLGVASRLTFNADKTKANLFATLGEGKPAGVILSGHTDTVPWDGQDWSGDPLDGAVRDGKLLRPRFGRHEELHRDRAGPCERFSRQQGPVRDPPGFQLRRGGRLFRRRGN